MNNSGLWPLGRLGTLRKLVLFRNVWCILLKYRLPYVDDAEEFWLDHLNTALPLVKLGATPPSLERLSIGCNGTGWCSWCPADGPLPPFA